MGILDRLWKMISQFLGPLALIAAVVFGVNQCNRANKAEKSSKIVTQYIESKVDLDTIRDEKGLEHALFESNEVTREEIISNRVDSVGSVIDSIIEPYKEKIQSLTMVNASLNARLKGIKKDKQVVYKDSVIKWVFYPETDTLDLDVNLRPTYLTYSDGLSILGFNVGTRKLYNDIWWNDSRIKFNSVNNLQVVNELPKNTFELSVASEYRFKDDNVLIGPEVQLNVNRWGLNGSYLYNIHTKQVEPSAGIKFHLIK